MNHVYHNKKESELKEKEQDIKLLKGKLYETEPRQIIMKPLENAAD